MAEILIVEDEAPINELIRRTLTATGHHCLQAHCGLEAVQLCKNALQIWFYWMSISRISAAGL
ncbi:MAG: hypothetical protein ACLTNO_01330 [Blautia sp.]